MKVSTEQLEKRQIALEVEVDADQLEKSMERAYRRLVNRTAVPGFRKGKAPRAMLERYIGKGTLLSEAIDIIVPEAYNQAIEEQNIETFGQPHIEITTIEPLAFKATVALEPTVTLGDFSQLKVEQEPVQITDDQINEVVEELRQNYAPWEPVERPVQAGDMVTMDIHSEIETEKGTNPYINQDAAGFVVDPERKEPVAGFAEELVGMNKGDTKEFTINLPDDYPAQSLAGSPVHFKVTVSEVKEKHLPELDDEFAKGVGPGYDSLQAMRDRIVEDLRQGAEQEAKEKLQREVVDAVVAQAEVEYPDMLVEHEIEHLIQSDRNIYRDPQGRIDEYLQAVGQTEEEFKERYREEATQRVVRSLVLQQVAENEGIDVDEGEVEAEIDRMMEGTSAENQEALRGFFKLPERRASIRRTLMGRRTLDRLVTAVTGIEPSKEPESVGVAGESAASPPDASASSA